MDGKHGRDGSCHTKDQAAALKPLKAGMAVSYGEGAEKDENRNQAA